MRFCNSLAQITHRSRVYDGQLSDMGITLALRQLVDPQLKIVCNRLFQQHVQTKHYATRSTTYYYDVLGITSKATQSQIKSAYFSLSKVYHPDMNKSAEAKAKFEAVSEAYSILSNVQKRRQYDRVAYKPSIRHAVHNIRRDSEYSYPPEIYRRPFRPQSMGRTPYYDFDEFYKNHYGESLRRDQNYQNWKEENSYEQQARKLKEEKEVFMKALTVVSVLFASMIFLTLSF